MKTEEDEAWEEVERRQAERIRKHMLRPVPVKSFEEAFEEYLDNMGHFKVAGNEEVRRHFTAGWVAGIRNEWAKERND